MNIESVQDTHSVKLNTDVQSTLATECEKNTIGTFSLEYVGDIIGCDGQEVDFGSEMVRCLNGSDLRQQKKVLASMF